VRAIAHGLNYGAHGLPLMGSGDWNDGMNLVGIKGKGESVWLGFFLCGVLKQFAEVARLKGDTPFAERCQAEEVKLRVNLEEHGWTAHGIDARTSTTARRWIRGQRRVPHRLRGAELVGAFRRGRARALANGNEVRR